MEAYAYDPEVRLDAAGDWVRGLQIAVTAQRVLQIEELVLMEWRGATLHGVYVLVSDEALAAGARRELAWPLEGDAARVRLRYAHASDSGELSVEFSR